MHGSDLDRSMDRFINCLQFDRSSKNLCAGTKTGVRLLDYSNPTELRCVQRIPEQAIYLCELIPETDILIFVPDESREKLLFHDFKDNLNERSSIKYLQPIIRIRASTSRIVVALENTIFIYSSKPNEFMVLLKEIASPLGKILPGTVDLSDHPVKCSVAYPNFDKPGNFIIVESEESKTSEEYEKKTNIQAHDNTLLSVVFDPNGNMVASASEYGTLIKVNRVFNGECIYEFKRGLAYNISINSLSFSKDARFLCAIDSTDTLKVYKLSPAASIVTTGSNWIGDTIQRIAEPILPENASKILFDENPFACAKLPEQIDRKATSIVYNIERTNIYYIMVANTDGIVHIYSLDIANGGECEFLMRFSIQDGKFLENMVDSWVVLST